MATSNRYHHGDLRAAIIDRAEQVLAEGGVGALSLRELARDLGVSHGAPSRHFTDKGALLDALALRGFERLGDRMGQALEYTRDAPFIERLHAMAAAYAGFAVDRSELLDLMFAAKYYRGATPELKAVAHAAMTTPLTLIAQGQRDGDVTPGDIERIGLAAISAVHGFAALAASGNLPGKDFDGCLRDLITILYQGMNPR